jgi:hypothetical protein
MSRVRRCKSQAGHYCAPAQRLEEQPSFVKTTGEQSILPFYPAVGRQGWWGTKGEPLQ